MDLEGGRRLARGERGCVFEVSGYAVVGDEGDGGGGRAMSTRGGNFGGGSGDGGWGGGGDGEMMMFWHGFRGGYLWTGHLWFKLQNFYVNPSALVYGSCRRHFRRRLGLCLR